MPEILKERIMAADRLSEQLYRLTVSSEYIVSQAKPGQFVNIKCCDGLNALLRRPISICDIDSDKNTFDIVFQVRGAGTRFLSQKKAGDVLDFIGPLGKPFDISENFKKIAVVGGGIGIFPLLFLLKSRNWEYSSAFLGFRNSENVVMLESFEKACHNLDISTDDGSAGVKGLVTTQLEKDMERNNYDVIYACGPTPMLKKTAEAAEAHKARCQVSMEQRMGCGIGACLVCACKTRLGDEWEYSHVCKDGPVFWSEEVIFE